MRRPPEPWIGDVYGYSISPSLTISVPPVEREIVGYYVVIETGLMRGPDSKTKSSRLAYIGGVWIHNDETISMIVANVHLGGRLWPKVL